MQKRKIFISLIILIMMVLSGKNTFAASTGIITGQTVKIRESASLDSKLVMLISLDQKVEVIEKVDDWYKVKYEDKTGYIFKDYIEVKEEVVEEKSENTTDNNENKEEPKTENENNNNEENINNDNIIEDNMEEEIVVPSKMKISEDTNINILPVINSSVIGSMKKNSTVTITEHINGWVYIVSEDISGWVRKENLIKEDIVDVEEENIPVVEVEKPEPVSATPFTKKKAYVNVDSVNVRKEANTTSEKVSSLNKNAEITVVGKEDDWSQIEGNNIKGYVLSKYLSDKKVEEVTNRSSDVARTEISNTVEAPKQVNTDKASEIVSYAKSFLGVKYKSAGASPSGFDCSGFTYYVYKHFGYSLSRSSAAQSSNGTAVSKADLQLGDLVFFSQGSNSIGHVGIYVGGNSFIHSSSPGDVVKITSLSDSYYKTRYVTARRIIK